MTFSDFFTWWTNRLAELVPAALHAALRDTKASLTLAIDNDRIELSTPQAETVVALDAAAPGPFGRSEDVDALLSSMSASPQRIHLTLAPSNYLVRRLTLPRAARADLAEAVRYQLPQLTPFSADRLLYACGEKTNSPGEGDLDVWLVAIPRQHVERALALIGQSPPQNPLPLQRPPAIGESLEITWRVAESSISSLGHRRLAWLGLIALWLAVPIVHMYQVRSEQTVLEGTLATLRADAKEVSELRDRLEVARIQTAWLGEHKQAAVSALVMMDSLSDLLDDQTWLQGLDLKGDRLKLRGLSSSPATVIETLEASSLLEEVRFDAAITRDGRGQGDRFNISARIASAVKDGSS